MNKLSFRIWFPFTIMFLIIMLFLGLYYSERQETVFTENRQKEVNQIAETLKKSIQQGLKDFDLKRVKIAMDIAKNSLDFEAVVVDIYGETIVEGDSTIAFSKKNEKDYIYKEFTVVSKVLENDEDGVDASNPEEEDQVTEVRVRLISSKSNLEQTIKSLNRPVYFILLAITLLFVIVIVVYTRFITRPFTQLSVLSQNIDSNLESLPTLSESSIDEVKLLQKSLRSLFEYISEKEKLRSVLLEELKKELSEKNLELEQLSMVAKYTTSAVIITNERSEIIWVNEGFEKLTEYSFDEVNGMTPKMLQFEKTDKKTLDELNKKIKNLEIIENLEILNVSKSGREYWISLNIVPIFNDHNLVGFIAIQSDVTERKLKLQAVEKSETELRDLLNNSSELIHTVDLNGKILWVNRSWKDTLKVGNEVIGMSLEKYLGKDTLAEFAEVIPKLNAGEEINDLNCVFISAKSDKIVLRGKAIPVYEQGEIIGSQAYLQDITKINEAQKSLSEKSSLQELIMKISTDYINLPVSQYYATVRNSLELISNYIHADRAYVFNYDEKQGVCHYTHEWVSKEEYSQIESLKQIQISDMPYWYEQHKNKQFVLVEDTNTLDNEEIRKMLRTEKIKSIITIPINDGDDLIGFVGFDLIREKRNFSEDEKEILRLYSEMLLNVYKRLDFINELNDSKKQIEQINQSLEEKVALNTKRNLDLSNSIVEQEKLATIGEISAGIAHDLNTPLGTIKVGADNVQFMLGHILTLSINKLEQEDLEFIDNFVKDSSPEMFVGGLQLRKEMRAMSEHIDACYGNSIENPEKLVELIVKSRIQTTDNVILDKIMNSSNPKLLMELLYQMQVAKSQLETIKKSSDKAVKVVQDVRAFIKGEVSQNEMKTFDLRENISTVLGIFSYEIKDNVDLLFEVDKNIQLYGYDVKLFQLWSNLIKNAFEAMEGKDSKYLGIKSSQSDNKIKLIFENNGPKIPDEVRENMFKKFYTTKAKKSGTGLGLSIVVNILKEHNAQIEVNSNDEITQFIVTFDIDGRI